MATAVESRLTAQQRRAIETRDVSVALSAGAGCGKTHVLVDRYVSHLAPGLLPGTASDTAAASPLTGLIAITFTDRAAREMRDRVRRTCRERLRAAPDEATADRWLELLRELETARISTIHAFCGSLLRSHAVEAGLDPNFETLQPAQAATLFSTLMDDELRRQLGERREELLTLVLGFGLGGVRQMVQHLLQVRHTIDFAKWAKVSPEQLVELWREYVKTHVLPAVLAEFAELPQMRTVREIAATYAPTHPLMRERLAELRRLLGSDLSASDPIAALRQIREVAKVQHAGNAKHWPDEASYARFRDAAAELRKWIDDTLAHLAIQSDQALPSAVAGLDLLKVAEPILALYQQRKRALGMLDFDDMLISAKQLLRDREHGERLRRQLSSQLVLLLVDEFQDTDPLQVELVETLCGDHLHTGKLFFVGDSKQSIYRFRGADPRVFRRLRDSIPSGGQQQLTLNFRSQPAVLQFVNALFCERLGPNYEALEANRQPLDAEPAVEFLWATLHENAEEKLTAEQLRQCEAEWIARRLAELFAAGRPLVADTDTKKARAAQPGDVAILFRALTDVQHYEAALRRYDIPYYLVGGSAFYAQQEVFDLLNLLRVLDCPHDTVSLAGVLRSPFFSLADESLLWLAQHADGLAGGLFDVQSPAQLDAREKQRVQFAARTLARLQARKDRLPISALILEALAATGYDALLLADFLGERKLANLRKLIDQARNFDDAGVFTLTDFVAQLAEFISNQPKEPAAPVEPETSTVVRLMSIHQSKGLEFPVVVVPDLSRQAGGAKSSLEFDPELGPLVRAPGRGAKAACGLDLFRLLERQEEADEEARLLYVATTRAADYLILASGVKDLDEPGRSWLGLVRDRFDLRTGKFTATLPPGYREPHVRVTLAEPPAPSQQSATKRPDLEAIATTAREQAATARGVVPRLVEPIPPDRSGRRVFSFSALSGQLQAVREMEVADAEALHLATPVEASPAGDGESAAELGTVVHAVLAQIDFDRSNDLPAKVARQLERRFRTTAIDTVSAVDMLERFMRSPRAAEFKSAQALHRELDFLLAWPPAAPANRAPEKREGSPAQGIPASDLSIQGVLDCLYQDRAGAWHIVDFKTNRIRASDVPQVAAAYALQMQMYALATEEILGQSPTSLVLHFLYPGVEHAVPWNARVRETTIAAVQAALTAARDSRPAS